MDRKQIIGGISGFLLLSIYSIAFMGFIKASGIGSDSSSAYTAASSYSSSSSRGTYDDTRDKYAVFHTTYITTEAPIINTEAPYTEYTGIGYTDESIYLPDSSYPDSSSASDSSSQSDSSSKADSSSSAYDHIGDFRYIDYETRSDTSSSQSDRFEKIGILEYIGKDKKVTVPGEVKGKTATILRYTFTGNNSVTDVTIENGPLTLDMGTFQDCTALKNVQLPDTLKVIGRACFLGCKELKEINIPEGVTKIDGGAFLDCVSLETIKLPSTLKILGPDAFYNIPDVTEVTVPKSVKEIGEHALGYYSKKVSAYDEIYEKYYDTYKSEPLDDFIIYGWSGTEAERYAEENGFDFSPLDLMTVYFSVSGTSDGELLENAEVIFTSEDGEKDVYMSSAAKGEDMETADLLPGKYTVTVSKEGYAPRSYDHVISEDEAPDMISVELHKYGDLDGSGKIDAGDLGRFVAHIKGARRIPKDSYDFAVADLDGDGKLMPEELGQVIAVVKGARATL